MTLAYSAAMPPIETTTPHERLATVHDRIARAVGAAGRAPDDVELIAISKMHEADVIQPLIDALGDLAER